MLRMQGAVTTQAQTQTRARRRRLRMCRVSDGSTVGYSDSDSDSETLMAAPRGPYSHCPLKKRPVLIPNEALGGKDDQDHSPGPENLSMKPQDLRQNCSTLKSQPAVTLASSKDQPKENTPATLLRHYLQAPSPLSLLNGQLFQNRTLKEYKESKQEGKYFGGPSNEFLSSSHNLKSHYSPYLTRYQSVTNDWSEYTSLLLPSEMSWSYDSLPLGFKQTAVPSQRRLTSNPSVNHCIPSGSFPVYQGANMRTPSPSVTPEDLSSPGSVASSGSCSASSTGYNDTNCKERYSCTLCRKSYSTYSGLEKHQQFHFADSKCSLTKKHFGCKSCDKVYVTLGALKMHIRTHTLPCKCVICGKAFSRPWLLQGHIRTHTGEKPFSCPLCERAFADRSNLRAHLQTHSEVKKYSCGSCGKTFSRMSLLTKHQEGGCSRAE